MFAAAERIADVRMAICTGLMSMCGSIEEVNAAGNMYGMVMLAHSYQSESGAEQRFKRQKEK
jgi:hypothetical protein